MRVSGEELAAIMDDIDVDKSGQLEFEEFVILSARFTYVDETIYSLPEQNWPLKFDWLLLPSK